MSDINNNDITSISPINIHTCILFPRLNPKNLVVAFSGNPKINKKWGFFNHDRYVKLV